MPKFAGALVRPINAKPCFSAFFLRTNPATAKAYGELKRLQSQFLAQTESHREVKDPAVESIHFAAEQWAQATRWQANRSARIADGQ